MTFFSCSKSKPQENFKQIKNHIHSSEQRNTLKNASFHAKNSQVIGGKMLISEHQELYQDIFLAKNTVESLQNAYNHVFNVQKVDLDTSYNSPLLYKLSYKNSYIKIHYNKFENEYSDNIVCAVIVDKEIKMSNSIMIGMMKDDFFMIAIGQTVEGSIDTLWNGDAKGEIEQQFIFKNDKLDKVLISSSYDCSDFNFYDKLYKE